MAPPTRNDEGPLAAVLLGVSLGLLVGGGLAELLGSTAVANTLWALATVAGLGPAVRWVWSSARERRVGVDIIAVLALIGTLAVDEYLAGAVISVMLATGRTLEARATARARSDLRALQERAPRARPPSGGSDADLTTRSRRSSPATCCSCGPARSSRSTAGSSTSVAVLDESALTGESLPVERRGRRRRAQRRRQRRRPVRPAGDQRSGREHLRRHRAAGRGGGGGVHRPVRRLADRYAVGVPRGEPAGVAGVAWALSGVAVGPSRSWSSRRRAR